MPGFEGVYSGGDCQTGPATVIRAINAGKVAAANIDHYLGFDHNIELDVDLPPVQFKGKRLCGRCELKERDAAERIGDFEMAEIGLTEEEAHQEGFALPALRPLRLRCVPWGEEFPVVKLIIDDREVEVPEHTTILDAAASVGIKIPTLCYLRDLNEVGACRVCVVEIEGIDQLVAACNNYVLDGMVVHTNSQKARVARKTNVEFLLSQHDSECTSCTRSGNCSLQSLANDLGITDLPFPKHLEGFRSDPTFPLIRNNDKCIKCLRCIQICEKVQATGVWDLTSRASHTVVNVAGGKKLSETDCALCGQCITHCPTGALRARDDTERVFDALGDPDKICLVQVAPAVRTSWGESLGLAHEDATVKRLASALRMMGFDYVFDTNFSADLTIMEEGSELLERIKKAGEPGGENIKFPMFTSCCPGWIRYVKSHYPDMLDQVSTSKSPQQMFGAVAKTYYADALGVDPSKIFSVSIMPCVAKKSEAALPTMVGENGDPDVGRRPYRARGRPHDSRVAHRRDDPARAGARPAAWRGYRCRRHLRRDRRRHGRGAALRLLPGDGREPRPGCLQRRARSGRLEREDLRFGRDTPARGRGARLGQRP